MNKTEFNRQMTLNAIGHVDDYVKFTLPADHSDPTNTIPLPDYSQSNGTFLLQDEYFKAIDNMRLALKSREFAFYIGALAVLNILSDESLSNQDMVNLARQLVHESRNFVDLYNREHPDN